MKGRPLAGGAAHPGRKIGKKCKFPPDQAVCTVEENMVAGPTRKQGLSPKDTPSLAFGTGFD
jgi:hypothetical protein